MNKFIYFNKFIKKKKKQEKENKTMIKLFSKECIYILVYTKIIKVPSTRTNVPWHGVTQKFRREAVPGQEYKILYH